MTVEKKTERLIVFIIIALLVGIFGAGALIGFLIGRYM
jgi:hypothetical protein